jgi:hypothetical protein
MQVGGVKNKHPARPSEDAAISLTTARMQRHTRLTGRDVLGRGEGAGWDLE